MEKKFEIFLAPPLLFSLDAIQQVSFSAREVDILACLIGCRTAKKIASLLLVSPRTVENHIRNVMIKIGCNSRDGIVTFIEQSEQLSLLQGHYKRLRIQYEFEKKLKEIAKFNTVNAPQGMLFYEKSLQPYLLSSFQSHFKMVGLSITAEKLEVLSHKTPEEFKADFLLYILSDATVKKFQEEQPISSILPPASHTLETILYVCLESQQVKDSSRVSKNLEAFQYIQKENYYFLAFDIFKKLIPSSEFEPLFLDFKNKYEQIMILSQGLFSHTVSDNLQEGNLVQKNGKDLTPKQSLSFFYKNRNWFLIIALLFFILFSAGIVIIKGSFEAKNPSPFKIAPSLLSSQQNTTSIRSDILLPAEEAFLDRPALMHQIEDAFKGSGKFRRVALVGIGGAGKTTLARQYAHSQKASIVWEINAETKESLTDSFENLAQALLKTEEDKKAFKELKNIINQLEREAILIKFVKDHLKLYEDWFLIYDNIDNFYRIQKYFPQDSNTWGQGKVILTTRDNNIQSNKLINSAIQIGELDAEQKLGLFVNIMYNKNKNCLGTTQLQKTKDFLKNIPPFPLDVSVAAYYLKATNTTYAQYLENLTHYNKDFTDVQEKLLKNASDYNNTRYKIIATSLIDILNINDDFKKLFLFLSVVDSQKIPVEALNMYKNNNIVSNFIYNLKKYSLIIDVPHYTTSSNIFISLHRCTQEIILSYFLQKLNLERNKEIFQEIATALVDYISVEIEKEEFSNLITLINHCEKLLEHKSLLDDNVKGMIESAIGHIYFYLGNEQKAKNFLEQSLLHLNKKFDEKNGRIPLSLLYLGATYRDLGDYEKAKKFLEQSLRIYKRNFPENYIGIARSLAYLGATYGGTDHEKARKLLEESLIIYQKYYSEKLSEVAWVLLNLGNVYKKLGNFKEAENSLNQSLLTYKHLFSTSQPGNIQVLSYLGKFRALVYLGEVYFDLGHYENAKKVLEKSLIFYKKHFQQEDVIAWVLTNLGSIYSKFGEYEEAKNLFEKSLMLSKKFVPETHIRSARNLPQLGIVYRELGHYTLAKNIFEKALVTYKSYYGEDHIEVGQLLRELGKVYLLEGKLQAAEDIFQKALAIFQKYNHPWMYFVYEDFSDLSCQKSLLAQNEGKIERGDYFHSEATAYVKKAYEGVKIHFPETSAHLKKIQSKLKKLQP